MRICRTVAELRAARRSLAHPLGFVPTMGALHAGHESLVKRAREECASVVASVFVNPLQFGPNEDLDSYPRPLDDDLALLDRLGADAAFVPSTAEMYPPGSQTRVEVGDLPVDLALDHRLGDLDADVIALQEVWDIDDGPGQSEALAGAPTLSPDGEPATSTDR